MVSFPNPRDKHPFHMHDMIHSQPHYLTETLNRLDKVTTRGLLGGSPHLIVTGCGTSFHAAMFGARVLQEALGPAPAVSAVHAYDLAYGVGAPPESTVLGVSHSGSTSTTNLALRRARRARLRTIGLCGLPRSAMAAEASRTIVIGSTHDHSWANTMSYTTQLTAFAALAAHFGGPGWAVVRRALRRLPRVLEKTLGCEGPIRRVAASVARRERVTFLASDLDMITALEATLKIRETSGLPASGYHMEQLLHGPCLSIDRRESVIMLRSRTDGPRSEAIRRSVLQFGARVTTVGDAPWADIRLPSVHRILRPIVSIVPLQFLAYYTALARGANPDIMRTDIPRYRAGLAPLFQ